MKRLIAIIIAGLMIIGVGASAMDPTSNFKFHRMYAAEAQDAIWFDHKAHVIREGRDCNFCHIDRIDIAPNIGFIAGATKGHDACRNCHIDRNSGGATSPTGCAGGENAGDPVSGSCHGYTEP